MITIKKITDEEILGYLLGDCGISQKKIIEDEIEKNLEFKKRVDFLSQIQKQVHSSPVDCFTPVTTRQRTLNVWRLIPTCSLIILSFVVGLYIEAQFVFLGSKTKDQDNNSVTTEIFISKPLDWDERRFSSLM